MIDYITWRGDITFEERGLNEVDSLIFSELVYTDLDDVLPVDSDKEMTIAEIYDHYTRLGIDQSATMNDPLPILRKAAISERFMRVRVRYYYEDTNADQQVQFSAMTFLYKEDEAYIAFRGTDNTIIGWHECFNMSFLSETPGQQRAVSYLNKVAPKIDGKLYVGGHSKGGNFAVYACAFCEEEIKNRIEKVYSNDGPGFLSEVAGSEQYKALLPKIVKFVPDSSLVGSLLEDDAKPQYIRSSEKGFAQHNPYTWQVVCRAFEHVDEQSQSGIFMSETMRQWLETLDDKNRRLFVNAVFNALDSAGVKNVNDLNENRLATYHAILKAVSKLDSDSMNDFQNTLKMLVKTGKDIALSGNKYN